MALTKIQARKFAKVMHEYGRGKLRTSAGAKVKSSRQALAIAFSVARRRKRR